jgi:TonB family protein
VGNCDVVRSLDGVFGLDQEAIKAARQWRFAPGMKQGVAVPVLVTISMGFTLR